MEKNQSDINWESYFWDNSDVLKNKLFIHDKNKLKEKEIELSFYRQVELMEQPIVGKFDTEHLKNIHYYLFQDIYEFAGKFRNVDIEKNACTFVHWQEIPEKLQMELELMEKDLRNINSIYDFAEHLSKYFSEIIYIHPFREVNGRSTREFIREYACEKSKLFPFGPLEFLWSKVDVETINHTIHFSMVFRSAITLEFLKALVPLEQERKR